jgi:hypothetical protein
MTDNFAVGQIPHRSTMKYDSAPQHYHNEVHTFLDRIFSNWWIGRAGPIAWPPRSPHLTPPYFFLWGFMKKVVYQQTVQHLQEVRKCITNAVAQITHNMLENTPETLNIIWTSAKQQEVLY